MPGHLLLILAAFAPWADAFGAARERAVLKLKVFDIPHSRERTAW